MFKLICRPRRMIFTFFLAIFLCLFILGSFFFKIYRVSHSSMSNTLADGDRVLVKIFRIGEISRNDILIFAHAGNRYIKRCVAVAGDTVQITDWKVSVNSHAPEPFSTIRLTDAYNGSIPTNSNQDSGQLFDLSVFQEYHRYWNLKNFGPYIVPKRGLVIKLDEANIKLYSSLVKREIGESALQKLIARGTKNYRFREDYFFMVGDNRPRSTDSRSFGGIKKEQVIGKVIYLLYRKEQKIESGQMAINK